MPATRRRIARDVRAILVWWRFRITRNRGGCELCKLEAMGGRRDTMTRTPDYIFRNRNFASQHFSRHTQFAWCAPKVYMGDAHMVRAQLCVDLIDANLAHLCTQHQQQQHISEGISAAQACRRCKRLERAILFFMSTHTHTHWKCKWTDEVRVSYIYIYIYIGLKARFAH